ncbi:MAG: inositol monophosphatase [Actinomadura rubrobrunea]|nr:inositol monophosphatase [Actinomadura rubrobrunea]
MTALESARSAGEYLRARFGLPGAKRYLGDHDVQLNVDVEVQEYLVHSLTTAFPDYGILAEEGLRGGWPDTEFVWVIDPLDGTNNFGYGIAHCAIAIALFHLQRPVAALVVDPLLQREFVATEHTRPDSAVAHAPIPLRRSTISLVTNYSTAGRLWGNRMNEVLGGRCKRLVSLWAPALDLALISAGQLDGMICHAGDMLDVGGGMLLVTASGGCVVDPSGAPMAAHGSMFGSPVSFVAARTRELADELLQYASAPDIAAD